MKNASFFPFERNKYFYGKLLSVDDFELEQRYGSDKRRSFNRFVCGSGIVAGLSVVGVDEQTVSVEAGFALDAFGREIAIETPVIKKLSFLDGFESCINRAADCIYLCLEYGEEETTPVHNITAAPGALNGGTGGEFSRIREGYHLYLTAQEPEVAELSSMALCEDRVCVFKGEGVTINQVLPKFAKAGEELELRVEIENLSRQYIAFSYETELTCLSAEGGNHLTVSFDEMLFEKSRRYTLTYRLRAAGIPGEEGTLRLDESSFRFFVEKTPVETRAGGSSVTILCAHDEREELLASYHRDAMDQVMRTIHKETLYLARIFLIQAEESYLIDSIDNVPFGQYVMTAPLTSALCSLMLREMERTSKRLESGSEGGGSASSSGRKTELRLESGTYCFDLKEGGARGKRYLSEEIFHGLGLGAVSLSLSTEEEGGVLFGSHEIFEDRQVRAELAALSDETKGSFQIGIRLLEAVTGGRLTVRWTAILCGGKKEKEQTERRLFIKPGILELGVRESYYLEAVVEGMTDRSVLWSVDEESGFIDEKGCYTAPNVPGVYEVVAKSAAAPEIRASIFVVVRGEGRVV